MVKIENRQIKIFILCTLFSNIVQSFDIHQPRNPKICLPTANITDSNIPPITSVTDPNNNSSTSSNSQTPPTTTPVYDSKDVQSCEKVKNLKYRIRKNWAEMSTD